MSDPTPPSDSKIEVLIAEDSPTQAQRLQHILEQQGYQVTHAANGRLALEAARRRKPMLIISDVVMPEMDGYELCRRVKSDPSLAGIAFILVTTLSDPHDVIRGLECHADNFLLKPYDERFLLSRVQFVLLNREVRQADGSGMGVEVVFNHQKHFITADRLQILNLLLSTYEAAIERNSELSRSQERLRQLNAKLETANKELEAFSYSVSHDLRAPLRHINGFSGMLLAKHSAHLPADAQRLLHQVAEGGRRMNQLIDDLLEFSRLGRQSLAQQPVSVSALVKETLIELAKDRADRSVEISVGELPDCSGDRAMLKQVLVNLLSNALKFTRRREKAVVEVGCRREKDALVYFVRDNGAGFDPKYADKLFGVFQRLHSGDQFEGTGIGLSIVQRIIQRHNGRIWAEAEVEKGATFFFSLPLPPPPRPL